MEEGQCNGGGGGVSNLRVTYRSSIGGGGGVVSYIPYRWLKNMLQMKSKVCFGSF